MTKLLQLSVFIVNISSQQHMIQYSTEKQLFIQTKWGRYVTSEFQGLIIRHQHQPQADPCLQTYTHFHKHIPPQRASIMNSITIFA